MAHSADPHRRSDKQKPVGALALSRRKLPVSGAGPAAALAGLGTLRHLAAAPVRLAGDAETAPAWSGSAPAGLPDVQFDLAKFVAPVVMAGGIAAALPPVYTLFAPARLRSRPSQQDSRQLADALDRVEEAYAFAPQGAFTFVSYGLPYFGRFPSWMFNALVPRLSSDENRFALEEAVPAPADGSPANPGIARKTLNVPVRIEQNDMLITLRSDNVDNLGDVMAFLAGRDRLAGEHVPSPRLNCGLTFTSARVMFVQRSLPRSVADSNNLPVDSFVNPAAPTVTFQGADGVSVTTAEAGDYFDNGSMQHLSHVILDMPDGSRRPKLEFTAFVPSADFCTTMRKNQALAGLQEQFSAEEPDNGLGRFITSTRRQNFLIPPRRHRAFPFAELCGRG
jgi:hypothetical protein